MPKALSFVISSNFGYFKKFSSTTSPVTHGVIPKTTLIGLVSAIIGKFENKDDYNVYLDYFNNDNCKIAIELLHPVKKTMFGINYQNLKDIKKIDKKVLKETSDKAKEDIILFEDFLKESGQYDRGNKYTQVNMEVVKNPSYRIYFSHTNDYIYNTLKDRLLKNETYYPTFMGTSDFPLVISDVKEVNIIENTLETEIEIDIHSVVPFEKAKPIYTYYQNEDYMERLNTYIVDKQPYLFIRTDTGKRNIEFIDVLYNSLAGVIRVKTKEYYTIENQEKAIMFY